MTKSETNMNKLRKFNVFNKEEEIIGQVKAKDFFHAELQALTLFPNDYESLMYA